MAVYGAGRMRVGALAMAQMSTDAADQHMQHVRMDLQSAHLSGSSARFLRTFNQQTQLAKSPRIANQAATLPPSSRGGAWDLEPAAADAELTTKWRRPRERRAAQKISKADAVCVAEQVQQAHMSRRGGGGGAGAGDGTGAGGGACSGGVPRAQGQGGGQSGGGPNRPRAPRAAENPLPPLLKAEKSQPGATIPSNAPAGPEMVGPNDGRREMRGACRRPTGVDRFALWYGQLPKPGGRSLPPETYSARHGGLAVDALGGGQELGRPTMDRGFDGIGRAWRAPLHVARVCCTRWRRGNRTRWRT